jgi:hypothetical protein
VLYLVIRRKTNGMRAPFEKDRSLKKLQSQIAELDRDHPSYAEVVIDFVDSHNRRMAYEREIMKAVTTGPVEDRLYEVMGHPTTDGGDRTICGRLDDYLRDAISRFVNNELP